MTDCVLEEVLRQNRRWLSPSRAEVETDAPAKLRGETEDEVHELLQVLHDLKTNEAVNDGMLFERVEHLKDEVSRQGSLLDYTRETIISNSKAIDKLRDGATTNEAKKRTRKVKKLINGVRVEVEVSEDIDYIELSRKLLKENEELGNKRIKLLGEVEMLPLSINVKDDSAYDGKVGALLGKVLRRQNEISQLTQSALVSRQHMLETLNAKRMKMMQDEEELFEEKIDQHQIDIQNKWLSAKEEGQFAFERPTELVRRIFETDMSGFKRCPH